MAKNDLSVKKKYKKCCQAPSAYSAQWIRHLGALTRKLPKHNTQTANTRAGLKCQFSQAITNIIISKSIARSCFIRKTSSKLVLIDAPDMQLFSGTVEALGSSMRR